MAGKQLPDKLELDLGAGLLGVMDPGLAQFLGEIAPLVRIFFLLLGKSSNDPCLYNPGGCSPSVPDPSDWPEDKQDPKISACSLEQPL